MTGIIALLILANILLLAICLQSRMLVRGYYPVDTWEWDGDLLLCYRLKKSKELIACFRITGDPELVLNSDMEVLLMNHRLKFRNGNAAECFREVCETVRRRQSIVET